MVEEKLKLDFLTKILAENLNEKEKITIEDILEICRSDEYLQNNRSDAYHYMNKLINLGVVIKIRNGVYKVDQENLKVALNETRL